MLMKAAALIVASLFATEAVHATQAYPCNSCTEAQVQTTARYNGATQLGQEFAIYDMTKNTIRMFVVNRKNTDTPLEPFSGGALPNRRTGQITPMVAADDYDVNELPVPYVIRDEFNLVRKAFVATNGSM